MNYHNISYPDMLNGEGLRVVLWLSGCSHKCQECQNPQTWDYKAGIEFDKKAEEELFKELSKDYISGLTLSGGDPLHENNLDGVLELLNRLRILFRNTKTVWLYTGYEMEFLFRNSIRKEIIKLCDVVVDGRFEIDKKDLSLPFRGSFNQKIIDIQETLKIGKIILWKC